MCDIVWFYSTHFKFYIHLPSTNTQKRTTAPFDNTPVISYSDRLTTGLYQGSENCGEGDHNTNIIFLIQPSQAIHYCNQSVLVIVPDLNILVFSITIFDLILRSALVRFSLLRAIYLYSSKGLRFYIHCFRNQHRVFLISIVTGECTVLLPREYGFKVCAIPFCLY